MNTNPPTPKPTNGTFTFQCVVQFEIDPETATNLLVESDPNQHQTVHDWLLTQHPAREDYSWRGNADNLRGALGSYLTDNAISKARLLLPDADPKALPF